ncbi:heparinase II/III family protein [Cyclobacterium sp. 1_MG-2023]|uniref:heparinase II/III family protein n=1 Tax=Cyclobacterium sp. 1_MG-2023 TaxID=3062681 RepID=UPI0026E437E3|nr:heparinase II/III family protein [Cyclobacterium sp. 1_MG-2023]MDO6436890.1 heparinase II/III family protein [Cyclobacterium sp. 1_MG-2023]
MKLLRPSIAIFAFLFFIGFNSLAQKDKNLSDLIYPTSFVHPGILQNQADLDYMKSQIDQGKEPWKTAFINLKNEAATDFQPQAFTHVVRGSYGRKGQGHRELSSSAKEAYRQALLWYITEDRKHASKAIEIINVWSEQLWDFDDNDAKLIAALTGQHFLNAAEILRYSNSGWEPEGIQKFEQLMLTVFYPYIKDFFTEANGNWDAAMINTMLGIGVFTDRPDLFKKAVDRFFWGPNNGGITKYIYPNGQIQETTRDWPHVQLGLGEFAKAAQIAWTQGVDFYAVADNRLALGFEYTTKFMLGEEVPVYGIISQRGRGKFRDIYESVYNHYSTVKGIPMPNTQKAIALTRDDSGLDFLVAQKAPVNKEPSFVNTAPLNKAREQTGAIRENTTSHEGDAILVNPGQSIQKAINKAVNSGQKILLGKGQHVLNETLKLPSNIHLEGFGLSTILLLAEKVNGLTIGNQMPDSKNIVLKNFVIEGRSSAEAEYDPNQGRRARARQSAPRKEGLVFSANFPEQIRNIHLENLTVRNFTKNGVSLRGVKDVRIINCDFSDNGSNVVPGKGLHHNLHLFQSKHVTITGSRLSNSPWGSGIMASLCENIKISGNESSRNKLDGVQVNESQEIEIKNNLLEGNDRNGLYLEQLNHGNDQITIAENTIRTNGEMGIKSPLALAQTWDYNLIRYNKKGIATIVPDGQFLDKWNKITQKLNLPEEVKNHSDNPLVAARALLNYFRNRSGVIHPSDKVHYSGKPTQKDMLHAKNALKHVMVGQPAYPSYFVGWDIDWESQPVKDKEWVWQLNRMVFWQSMGKVYKEQQDEKYALEWNQQIIDWVIKNPKDQDHPLPWRSIEAGIRGNRWTHLFNYFLHSSNFTPEGLVFFLSSIYDHSDYLMTKYSTGSNWALMEAEGMAFIAMTFPEFKDADQWLKEAIRRFNNEIHEQVYPDGHQRELAFGYHMGSISWFLRTYELAQMNGKADLFSEDYLKMIEKMTEVPMKLAFPDGTTPQFGDAWTGSPGQHYNKLKTWAKLFDRPDFLYVATEGKEGNKPENTAFAFPQSGLYSMRSAWDPSAIALVLKCGPNGGGHSQPDNGTFALYAGGRNLTPDSGSFIYSGDPEGRAWFRQSKVHQTLTLNGENINYAPKLLLWKPGEKHDILVVENQNYEGMAHRRAVIFYDKSFFIIIDEALGDAEGVLDLNFQLAPGKVEMNENQLAVKTLFDEGYNLSIKAHETEGLNLNPMEGQVSFIYTKKEPRPAFSFQKGWNGKGKGMRFVTSLEPFKGTSPSDVIVKVASKTKIGSKKVILEISKNGKKESISYTLE